MLNGRIEGEVRGKYVSSIIHSSKWESHTEATKTVDCASLNRLDVGKRVCVEVHLC